MGKERRDETDRMEVEFKNMVFASNPDLYLELFEKHQMEDADVDWVIPETEADVTYMMDQLKRSGVFK
jgi:hypothetical protein